VGARLPGGAPAEVGRRRSRARVIEDEARGVVDTARGGTERRGLSRGSSHDISGP
jgi:hypothetical protein